MSSVVISGDTSGAITLAAPAVSGTNTATLPAATGTVMVSGNMPAFSAYAGSATSLTGSSYTKVLFDTEDFDTNSNFASSRFTPTIAGYYQINSAIQTNGLSIASILIYKNTSPFKNGSYFGTAFSSGIYIVTSIVYLNGSTDYVEIYGYNGSATLNTSTGAVNTYFNGCMVRSA